MTKKEDKSKIENYIVFLMLFCFIIFLTFSIVCLLLNNLFISFLNLFLAGVFYSLILFKSKNKKFKNPFLIICFISFYIIMFFGINTINNFYRPFFPYYIWDYNHNPTIEYNINISSTCYSINPLFINSIRPVAGDSIVCISKVKNNNNFSITCSDVIISVYYLDKPTNNSPELYNEKYFNNWFFNNKTKIEPNEERTFTTRFPIKEGLIDFLINYNFNTEGNPSYIPIVTYENIFTSITFKEREEKINEKMGVLCGLFGFALLVSFSYVKNLSDIWNNK